MLWLLPWVLLVGGCAGVGELPAPAPPQQVVEPVEAGPVLVSPESGVAPQAVQPVPPPGPPVLGPPAPPPPETPATPTSSLLAAVDAAMAAGELERAAALCERALRITPRDGNLWLKLATIRQRQGRLDEARGFAQRALSLAAGDARLELQGKALLELLELDSRR